MFVCIALFLLLFFLSLFLSLTVSLYPCVCTCFYAWFYLYVSVSMLIVSVSVYLLSLSLYCLYLCVGLFISLCVYICVSVSLFMCIFLLYRSFFLFLSVRVSSYARLSVYNVCICVYKKYFYNKSNSFFGFDKSHISVPRDIRGKYLPITNQSFDFEGLVYSAKIRRRRKWRKRRKRRKRKNRNESFSLLTFKTCIFISNGFT